MKRSTVADVHRPEDESELNDIRVSKTAWLGDRHNQHVDRLSKRVAAMTGLSTRSAERLQVVNYGIGGFYSLHHDYATFDDSKFLQDGLGNRIATVLFYVYASITACDPALFLNEFLVDRCCRRRCNSFPLH